jgi:hypothetical protein
MTGPTHHAEANALLALQAFDTDEARRALGGLTAKELADLARAGQALAQLCTDLYIDLTRTTRLHPRGGTS